MAFATSNIQSSSIGNLKCLAGDWTVTAGDAPGTITLAGGRIYLANFENKTTVSPTEMPETADSVTNGTITLTVYAHQTCTNGTFLIIYA